MGISELKRLFSSDIVTGLHLDSSVLPDPVCEPCIAGKQHRIVNKTATCSIYNVPLEIVHCNMHGPMPVASIQGHKYFMMQLDSGLYTFSNQSLKHQKHSSHFALKLKSRLDLWSSVYMMTRKVVFHPMNSTRNWKNGAFHVVIP